MKKFFLSFAILPLFFLFTSSVFADYTSDFTVSNVSLNTSTFQLTFDVSGNSFSLPDALSVDLRDIDADITSLWWRSASSNFTCTGNHCTADLTTLHNGSYPDFPSDSQEMVIDIYDENSENHASQAIEYGCISGGVCTTSSQVKIVADPESGSKMVGTPFNVDVKVTDDGEAFNAARATVSVSSNLAITGIHNATSNACNLQYTQTPTTSNPSFAGAIYGGSSTGCTVYTLTLTPTDEGTGTITFTNGSIKAYSDSSEIMTGVQNASFTIADGPTPTPTPELGFTITNVLQTYHSTFNLTGTKLEALTHIFVNGSDEDSTYPTDTTWQNSQSLSLGDNNFTIYGSDDEDNQTATQTVTVSRHTLGDINGDGNVDLIDASLFAVDWDKTENLTYILSDMNDDGNVDLTDLSILAKLIE